MATADDTPLNTDTVLDVLQRYNIVPDHPDTGSETDFPEIGGLEEGETVYTTSVDEVLAEGEREIASVLGRVDDIDEWWIGVEDAVEAAKEESRVDPPISYPPEPFCAWYNPIHFFGADFGIYIRQQCIDETAVAIAKRIAWPVWPLPHYERSYYRQQLRRAAFYVFFLHEQFHHKVESFGFRLLLSSGQDCYRNYKKHVYRPSFGTDDCLEEALANADSYERLKEKRYADKLEAHIREGLRAYLRREFRLQPPGYRLAENFMGVRNLPGRHRLQSMIRDGRLKPSMPADEWRIAPHVITSLMNIDAQIYIVLGPGARPIFNPTHISPGATASTRELVRALERHYGYARVPGGKGSHQKLEKPGAKPIIIPGNRAVVSPNVVKQVLNELGGLPISALPDVLDGRVQVRPGAR
jgi:predicted RNA binding protein YcfA (HicA-like mRNA interferase family)